jgi:hypothetical protein
LIQQPSLFLKSEQARMHAAGVRIAKRKFR